MKLSKIALFAAGISALSTPLVLAQTPALPQSESPVKKFCVVIDAGHGGTDTGLNTGVIPEKDVDLALVLKLRTELEKQGMQVVLTRVKDETMTLRERVSLANKVHPDCFITIHNGTDSQKEAAVINYYGTPSRRLASYSRLLLPTALRNSSSNYRAQTSIVEQPYFLLRKSAAPAIMVVANTKMISTPQQQQKFALGLAVGINVYSHLKTPSEASPTQKTPEVSITVPAGA